MKTTISKIYQYLKKTALKVFKVLENVWVKRVATVLVLAYAVYLIYQNFRSLETAITTLSINVPLAILSSSIVILTFILSISSWKFIVASFGFNFKWMDMAYVQMTSAIGKYIPGSIWNYSSKVYLSHRLGLPGNIGSLAIVVEVVLTYAIGACLFLLFVPASILGMISSTWFYLMRFGGALLGILIFVTPLLLSKITWTKKYFTNPSKLYLAILFRTSVWILSSLSFLILLHALGYPPVDLLTLIAVIAGSFFIGFIVIFIPDGILIRETIMVILLQDFLSKSNATIISLIFRLQLVILELVIILIIFLSHKRHRSQNE